MPRTNVPNNTESLAQGPHAPKPRIAKSCGSTLMAFPGDVFFGVNKDAIPESASQKLRLHASEDY